MWQMNRILGLLVMVFRRLFHLQQPSSFSHIHCKISHLFSVHHHHNKGLISVHRNCTNQKHSQRNWHSGRCVFSIVNFMEVLSVWLLIWYLFICIRSLQSFKSCLYCSSQFNGFEIYWHFWKLMYKSILSVLGKCETLMKSCGSY